MKSELKKITQEWMELERKTSKQRQVAELFYEEKLMALVVAEFKLSKICESHLLY